MLITDFRKAEETWDNIARSFDTTRKNPWPQCLNFIEKIKKLDTIVDIGCGNGRHLIPCAKRCKKAIGIDISRNLLRIVQKKMNNKNIKNIDLIHSNVVHLPIKDGSVDSILFIASLHNIKGKENRIQSLKEINRVLKPNGIALISVWSRWQDKYRKKFIKKWFNQINGSEFGDIDIFWRQHGLNIPRFYHLYSKKEFIHDIEESNLKIIRIDDVKIHSVKKPDNYFILSKKQ